MPHYMLATHGSTEAPAEPQPEMTKDEMAAMWATVQALEAEMKKTDTFVFSARLHGIDSSTVIRPKDGEIVMTDGPFIESKEFMAGFYIIHASDLDEALDWGRRTSEAIGNPIEVRPMMTHLDQPQG